MVVLDQWTKAFAASDVDAIVALYSADALFMGTGSKTVVTEPAAIRRYFEDAILTRRPRAAPISSSEAMVLSDDAVLIAGLNDFDGSYGRKTVQQSRPRDVRDRKARIGVENRPLSSLRNASLSA